MPVCENCGEEEFDCVDGHYFCQLCQTQSQDIREEEQEEEYGPNVYNRTLIIRTTAPSKLNKTVVKEDEGRPWSMFEGFTLVIREQVKALVKLGASPQLEDTVFKIWALYLSKVGAAFTEEKHDKKIGAENRKRLREKYPGTLESPKIKPVINKRTARKMKAKSAKHIREKEERSMLEQSLGGMEFYEGDNPYAEPSEESSDDYIQTSSDDEEEEEEEEETSEKQKKKKGPVHDSLLLLNVDRMTIRLTICFCQLGLMYTNNLVMPADLVRWVKKGKIPYKNVHTLFPDDMKFYNYDIHMFRMKTLIKTHKIRLDTGKLISRLGLKDFPEVSMHQLISKYLLELCLPAELFGLAMSLLNVHKPSMTLLVDRTKQIRNYAALAMAFIIILLKLLLGLDDSTERILSESGKELSGLLSNKQPFFIWSEWMEFMEKKRGPYQSLDLPSSSKEVDQIHDIGEVLQNYKQISKNQVRSYESKKIKAGERREALQKPLQTLLTRESTADQQRTIEQQLDQDPMMEFEDMETQPSQKSEEHEPDLKEDTTKKEEERFRASSIQYLLEDDPLEQMESLGLSDYTIRSSRVAASSSSEDEDSSPELSDMRDQRSHSKRRRKQSGTPAGRSLRDVLSSRGSTKYDNENSSRASINYDREKVQRLYAKLPKASSKYVLYSREEMQAGKVHHNFLWLVDLCSHLISENTQEIMKEIFALELLYFPLDRGLSNRELRRHQNVWKQTS